MSVYKDMIMLEMESPNEMYSDMMKTIKKSDEKKALKRLIEEYGLGKVYYMLQTNRRAFFQAVLQNWATHKQMMKSKG